MQYLDFNELYQADYDLDDLFVMNQNWQDGDFFSTISAPRKTSALLYFANCDAIYTFPDKTELHVLKNSLIYIPQHSEYKTRFINSQTPPATILIEFCTKMHNAPFCSAHSVTVLENETPLEIKKQIEKMAALYSSPIISYPLLKSELYSILAFLSNAHHKKNISHKFRSIAAGIEYMEKNINQELSIEEIAGLCYVSPCTFRRLFREYSGMSPAQYRSRAKIELAKKFLKSDIMPLSQIAETLNFEDTAYFCRVFKKICGCTPSEFKKRE